MATRSGGASIATVAQLQAARQSLMDHLGTDVHAVIDDRGLRLRVEGTPQGDVPKNWQGFAVEFTPPAAG